MSYNCPICDSKEIDLFLDIKQIPVYCNLLYKTRYEAMNAKRADMQLGFCKICGHVYNYKFNPDLMDYTQNYENSLHFSPRFQKYAQELAGDLVERYGLYSKDIVEIGCGDGDFLELLCKIGNNHGIGFDPSGVPDLDKTGDKKRITFIRDYFSAKYLPYKANLICCRHVLEHIQNPGKFLKLVRSAVGEKTDTTIFFEVPNVLHTLKYMGIWDLIYEHCSYFSSASFRTAFRKTGFEVIRDREGFQGQFLCIEAKPAGGVGAAFQSQTENLSDLREYVKKFEKEFEEKLAQWTSILSGMETDGRSAVVWGAGSKGIAFINQMQSDSLIKYIVDVNPHKQGKFIAVGGQEVVPPDFLKKYKPDVVAVMNHIYQKEIQQHIYELGLNAKLVIA